MSDITPEFVVHLLFYSAYYAAAGSVLVAILYFVMVAGAALVGFDFFDSTALQSFAVMGAIFGAIAYLMMEFRPCPRLGW